MYEDCLVVKACSRGNVCSVNIIENNIESHDYEAEVVYGHSGIVASSSTVIDDSVECLRDADCPSTRPICDSHYYYCIGCYFNDECINGCF